MIDRHTGISRRACRLLLAVSFALPLSLASAVAWAQESLSLPLPAQAAGAECTVVKGEGSESVTLSRTFSDDFDSLDLSSRKWTPYYDGGYDERTKRWQGYDWVVKRTAPGLREQQIYVDPDYRGKASRPLRLNPFRTENGILTITAERITEEQSDNLPGFQYTSGLLTTRQSFTQMFGYFEMRGRMPTGPHLVPAFWMLAEDRFWPSELDIMEAPSVKKDIIQSTLHWEQVVGQKKTTACTTVVKNYDKDFHYYGALWTPERIVYYIDRKPVGQVLTPSNFVKPMYMLVNLAVGGTWVGMATPGNPDMPVKMDVDSISAYTMGDPSACVVASNGVKTCQGK